jgi:hypothetical protein
LLCLVVTRYTLPVLALMVGLLFLFAGARCGVAEPVPTEKAIDRYQWGF